MRGQERVSKRKQLDLELRPFRMAGRYGEATKGLLRAVRKALNVPVAEIAERMGVYRSVVYDLEARELRGAIELHSMSRMAAAMGCKVVYGIVPRGGKTLERLADERMWAAVLEGQRTVDRDQGSGA